MSDRPTVGFVGLWLTAVGAAAQAAGLAADAWHHLRDPDAAATEALLSFTNVGHALLFGGMAAVILGATLLLAAPRLARARRALQVGIPVALAVVLGTATLAAANTGLGESHSHDHGATAAPGSSGDGHAHTHGSGVIVPDEPLDAATRERVAAQLVEARAVAQRYATVADAVRDGYRMVTPYLPLIGAHYIKPLLIDGTFTIQQPEMLLYDGTTSGSRIVGLSYYAVAEDEPAGFAGPNDRWHRHIGLCFDAGGVVVGSERTSAAECARLGGTVRDGSEGWMVHAWVVPGWESPQGVFSAENPNLR